jgi:hypothetical protein
MTKTTKPAADPKSVLLVLGYDKDGKPCGARFTGADPDLVAKAAKVMALEVYNVTSPEVAEAAKKLPAGQLYANGRGFVPNVAQAVYSAVIVELSTTEADRAALPVAIGLPKSWDEIAPGHLVIAQETLEYGWWEANSAGRLWRRPAAHAARSKTGQPGDQVPVGWRRGRSKARAAEQPEPSSGH